MMRRLIFEHWAIFCTLIAFVTALSIFLFISYRALRMSRKDTSRIANIPLEDDEVRVLADKGNSSANAHDNSGSAKDAGGSGSASAKDD